MPDEMLDRLDDKVALVLYFETEEAANEALVDPTCCKTSATPPA